jgi:hypothetical protein
VAEGCQRRVSWTTALSTFSPLANYLGASSANSTVRRSSLGHSFGGVLTQIPLDHGFGAAGVTINSVPAEGVRAVPLSQIKASFPVLHNPANRHRAAPFTPEQFHYALDWATAHASSAPTPR